MVDHVEMTSKIQMIKMKCKLRIVIVTWLVMHIKSFTIVKNCKNENRGSEILSI